MRGIRGGQPGEVRVRAQVHNAKFPARDALAGEAGSANNRFAKKQREDEERPHANRTDLDERLARERCKHEAGSLASDLLDSGVPAATLLSASLREAGFIR